jgi:hypothetical protein
LQRALLEYAHVAALLVETAPAQRDYRRVKCGPEGEFDDGEYPVFLELSALALSGLAMPAP